MELFRVGGAVRDSFLGLSSKDVDFAVEAESFEAMVNGVRAMGGEVFLETPQFFTVRANVPSLGAADFVLCRRESGFTDGRRPDHVEMGTIMDDLSRRDFTVNAMAIRVSNGELLDPFNGQIDLSNRLLRAVGDPMERLQEDELRALRAVRFAVTKGFTLDVELAEAMRSVTLRGVSVERTREELNRAFMVDTLATLELLNSFPNLLNAAFNGTGLRLQSTLRS